MRRLIKRSDEYIIAFNSHTGFYEIYEITPDGDIDLVIINDTVKETQRSKGDITVRIVWYYDEQFRILKNIDPEIYSEQLEEYKAELMRKGYSEAEVDEMIKDL